MSIKIPIETSARHLHISQKDFEKLFGERSKPHFIKELRESGKEPLLYILSSKVTFDSYAKLLICGDQSISLTSQACQLLDTFLNAPEYILTYEELLECLWKDGSGDMIRLRVAISRLRIVLSVDPEISIFQKDINKYQLVLPEKG